MSSGSELLAGAVAAATSVAGVEWSIQVRDLASGAVLADHEPDRVLRTASVGKVFLLTEVAAQLDAGVLDPAERLAWTDADLVADSGLWHRLDQRDLTVVDLCRLVGAVSDNLATNVLLRHVGLPAVTARGRSLGCERSALLDRVRDERTPDLPPTLSIGCADEVCSVLAAIARGQAVSPAVSAMLADWLGLNADQSMVGGGFGCDPLAHAEYDRGRWLVNKTGTISSARIDTGFVVWQDSEDAAPPPRGDAAGLAWFAGANWDADRHDPRDAVLAAMHDIGQALASLQP